MPKMAMLALVALMLAVTGDANAQGRHWPWCAYYDAYSYNCGFATLGQCVATISGVGGICRPNPYGSLVSPYDAPRRGKRARRR
jgi:hypothetical protein